MCTTDEETGLLRGGRRHEKINWQTLVAGSILFSLIGFAFGYLSKEGKEGMPSSITDGSIPLSKYTKFQPLSLQFYTGGAPVKLLNETDGSIYPNPECKDSQIFGTLAGVMHCYKGHRNTTEDVSDRVAIMTEAVERAYELSDKSSDTLKIFVAPEFFFRGRNGAYILHPTDQHKYLFNDDENGNCRAEICYILMSLEKLVADARFEDWVFLFGTAVLAETLPVEDAWDFLFYNFGILYRGYDPEAVNDPKGKRFLIPKRYVSNLDFLTPDRQIDGTRQIFQSRSPIDDLAVLNPHNLSHKTYDRRIWHQYKDELKMLGYTMIEYGWFIMDGITMTVEICLDHDMRTALTTYLADAANINSTLIPSSYDNHVEYVEIPKHQAQISIVSSAEMTVAPSALALADGGSIILQDGMNDDDVNMTWDYECFKYDWAFDGGSQVIQRHSTISPTEVLFHFNAEREYTKHSIYPDWKTSLRGVFSTAKYEPMIVAYPSKAVTLV
jgi:hypothetical protein